MTALEMAHDMGYPHDSSLCKLLSPTIRYNIPSQTLDRLQARFHDRIQEDLGSGDGDGEYGKHLRLPELEVLRELEVPQMGFPLVGPGVNEQKVSVENFGEIRIYLLKVCCNRVIYIAWTAVSS